MTGRTAPDLRLTMSSKNDPQLPRRTLSWRLFHFLGSMELAITLLITLAIASVIGTVLQQNLPYPDYLIKFGPFWFEVFESLGLYDVYSALWFLFILALLVVSTSVCLIRHTPSMLRDMVNLRTHIQLKSLKSMHHSADWHLEQDTPDTAAEKARGQLQRDGYRTRVSEKDDGSRLVSAMRGGANRLGYILTHLSIVVICVGGLLDSNLPLKVAEWRGQIQVETRDLPLSQIPQESRLAIGQQGFRGSISIPEGRASSVAYLPVRDGYLVQELPFTVEVEAFRIEHYPNGQPKSFESDLVIHDEDMEAPLRQTIGVNHPLIYKGYAIYQASFSDGGSLLNIDAWPLFAGTAEPVALDTKVFDQREMQWGEQSLTLEVTGFRRFNINPDPTDDDPRRIRDFGPSISFKLRQPTGEALEYENYMLPVMRDGREVYLSGVRSSPTEEFGYLHIPADDAGGVEGFMRFLHAMQQRDRVSRIAEQMQTETLAVLQEEADTALADSLQQTLVTLVEMFVRGGYDQVRDFIENTLPVSERERLGPAYLGMLREMLGRIYVSLLQEQSADAMVGEAEMRFFQDAVDAIGSLPRYAAPVYLALTDYEHIQATGLQVARSPGKNTVYLGCAMLTIGIFLLFYLPQRRLWLWMAPEGSGTRVYLAGMSNRNPREFDSHFDQMNARLRL